MARILEIIMPAGLEDMFEKFGQLGARRTDAGDEASDRCQAWLDDVDGLGAGVDRAVLAEDDGLTQFWLFGDAQLLMARLRPMSRF